MSRAIKLIVFYVYMRVSSFVESDVMRHTTIAINTNAINTHYYRRAVLYRYKATLYINSAF